MVREVLPAFEDANVCLALENYERYTSRELAALVREIGSPCLGVCLDTVNSLGAMETPAMLVPELAPFVRSLHVKDFKIERVRVSNGIQCDRLSGGGGHAHNRLAVGPIAQRRLGSNMIIRTLDSLLRLQSNIQSLLEQEWAARAASHS